MRVNQAQIEQVAKEVLVALRGRRSQHGWSKRLGYQSNVVHRWEAGKRWPRAAEFLRAVEVTGVDVAEAITRFFNRTPEWLAEHPPTSPEAVAHLLRDIQGNTPILTLSDRTGHSRFAISRWLSGRAQPSLPDFIGLVEAASMRVVDLIAELVSPEKVPTIRDRWRMLEARRRGADQLPWTQAILRALELVDYKALPAHRPGWIAQRLGISPEEEARCLTFLEETGQITWDDRRYRQGGLTVDTSRYPHIGRRLKAHWANVAIERIQRAAPGQFSYNVFTVSRADFEKVRQAHLDYFYALRAIVGASRSPEVVAVANIQLFALEDGGEPPVND